MEEQRELTWKSNENYSLIDLLMNISQSIEFNMSTSIVDIKSRVDKILEEGFKIQYIREHHKLLESIDYVIKREDNSDMHIIKMIRLLYLSDNNENDIAIEKSIKNRIIQTLSNFPYWPHQGSESPNDIVFWSENHIMMMLSSSHLIRQYLGNASTECSILEERLLRLYLEVHCNMNGVYECLSHVYLPYTIKALLNLYDFSIDGYIKNLSSKMLNLIVHQILLCTTLEGIATFSASSRSFNRTRTEVKGHNINELIYLYTGKGADAHDSSCQLSDFLLTTKWQPDQCSLDAYHFRGFQQRKISHNINEIRSAYIDSDDPMDSSEIIPFFWSAGLLYHPLFVKDTKFYMKSKNLHHRTNLWPLRFIPSVMVSSISRSLSRLSSGQCYLGVTLNVYKDRNICLSSFDNFQVNHASYQQQSWMANIEGIPLWSTSGIGSESLAGFAINNTYNPYCKQQGSVLVVSYFPPKKNEITQLFWPTPLFDNEKRQNEWWIAQKKDSYIGIFCTAPTRLETKENEDAVLETLYQTKTNIPRRCSIISGLSYIIVVGNNEFKNINEFTNRCSSIQIHEHKDKKNYTIDVIDDEQIEGTIKITTTIKN